MRGGFSLIEISIVLVIIGIITGGVLIGQDLIRSAEIQSIGGEVSEFKRAVSLFRDQYYALPGDFSDATDIWGAEPPANCPGNETTPSTSQATCDGDGNGDISLVPSPGDGNEIFRFWQHLANAGLIEGAYTGVQSRSGLPLSHTIGVNSPTSQLGNTGWGLYTNDNRGGAQANNYAYDFSPLAFRLGINPNTNSSPFEDALTPEEALSFDTKYDDGMPGKGKVLAAMLSECTTSADNTDFDGEYDTAVREKVCGMTFMIR